MTPASPSTRPPADRPASRQVSRDALPAGTVVGDGYRIERALGQGGFGIVYLATDTALQRTMAIKEYLPVQLAGRGEGAQIGLREAAHKDTFVRGLQSFLREARLLAQFDHPSLVRVYRFWEENHTAYMSMPYCEGPTLKAARDGMLRPPDEAWLRDHLLMPLLGALETLHAGSCLHRDVSPGNILLKSDGQPVLLDFGSARRVVGDMTQPLTAILNPAYAAIEQYAESPNLPQGPWTDLYGLAGVVYYALSGRAPVPATVRAVNEAALMPMAEVARLVSHNFPGLRYSAPFLAAIDSALAVRPGDRPQSAAAMREALRSSHVLPDVTLEGPPLQAVRDPGPPEIVLFDEVPGADEPEMTEEEERQIRAAIATAIGDVADWPPMARGAPRRIEPVLTPAMPARDERANAATPATPATPATVEARKLAVPPGKVALKVVTARDEAPAEAPRADAAAATPGGAGGAAAGAVPAVAPARDETPAPPAPWLPTAPAVTAMRAQPAPAAAPNPAAPAVSTARTATTASTASTAQSAPHATATTPPTPAPVSVSEAAAPADNAGAAVLTHPAARLDAPASAVERDFGFDAGLADLRSDPPVTPPRRAARSGWRWALAAALVALLGVEAWQWTDGRPGEALLGWWGSEVATPPAAPAVAPVVATARPAAGTDARAAAGVTAAPATPPAPAPMTTSPFSATPAPVADTSPTPAPEAAASGVVPPPAAQVAAAAAPAPAPALEPTPTPAPAQTSTSGTTGSDTRTSSAADSSVGATEDTARDAPPPASRNANVNSPPTRSAAAAPKPAAPRNSVAKSTPTDPRSMCGSRTNFSLYYCMRKQCQQARFASHPQCRRLIENDELPA